MDGGLSYRQYISYAKGIAHNVFTHTEVPKAFAVRPRAVFCPQRYGCVVCCSWFSSAGGNASRINLRDYVLFMQLFFEFVVLDVAIQVFLYSFFDFLKRAGPAHPYHYGTLLLFHAEFF
jgi:hypothetical protein